MEDLIQQLIPVKTTTDCCALCQLSRVNNNTSIKAIKKAIKRLKIEKDLNEEVGYTTGNGQTAVFTVVTPGENVLYNNLIKLGFVEVHQFERRKGYPETGLLRLMIKNL